MREILKRLIQKVRTLLLPHFKTYHNKLPYILTVIIALVVVVVGINLFIELTATLKTETLAKYDHAITQSIISYRNPTLTQYFKFVTEVGDVHGYLFVLGLSIILTILVFKQWRYIGQIVLVLVLASVSNMILKRFIDRARPDIEHLVVVKTLSYPSGHAMSAVAFYGFIIYLIYKFKVNKFIKTGLIVLFGILILSIGISRIYLGVHFPSDIVGGFIAGTIWVFFCILIFNLLEVFRKDPLT
ncbi:phosphatase PAP2 family protein [Flavivirga sp. 57AJ16]|uniref:phosphatase PAP2 family protein n=1 Tax=Flavivirga sp. 57AJ16 TaxID=3025307 RepID=UPI0023659F79|nr:phosphatase PAP2 family protein [Flavivirga sp. 57AJ16]MDD7886516.1 phosphatase PAP2 family protein [Flavivirga sp. 57AJ16]